MESKNVTVIAMDPLADSMAPYKYDAYHYTFAECGAKKKNFIPHLFQQRDYPPIGSDPMPNVTVCCFIEAFTPFTMIKTSSHSERNMINAVGLPIDISAFKPSKIQQPDVNIITESFKGVSITANQSTDIRATYAQPYATENTQVIPGAPLEDMFPVRRGPSTAKQATKTNIDACEQLVRSTSSSSSSQGPMPPMREWSMFNQNWPELPAIPPLPPKTPTLPHTSIPTQVWLLPHLPPPATPPPRLPSYEIARPTQQREKYYPGAPPTPQSPAYMQSQAKQPPPKLKAYNRPKPKPPARATTYLQLPQSAATAGQPMPMPRGSIARQFPDTSKPPPKLLDVPMDEITEEPYSILQKPSKKHVIRPTLPTPKNTMALTSAQFFQVGCFNDDDAANTSAIQHIMEEVVISDEDEE